MNNYFRQYNRENAESARLKIMCF